MAGILRKILPVTPSIHCDVDDDDYNVEYSFAMEYHGPPVTYDIPRVVPVDIDRIPTAAAVVSASLLNNLSLPVIQPIIKRDPASKKLSDGLKLGSEAAGSPNSVTLFEQRDKKEEIDSLGVSCSVDSDECAKKSTDGVGSSGTLGFSDSHDGSHELSESSDSLELPHNGKEDVGFQDCVNPDNFVSTELGLSPHDLSSEVSSCEKEDCINETPCHVRRPSIVSFRDPESKDIVNEESSHDLSSEISSCKEEDCNNETPCHVRRPSFVTFRDPESSDLVNEESGHDEAEIIREGQLPKSNVKKGLCHRCFKRKRFTEKEVCIVCSAKYCGLCVLRAMGSMPEGRKCVICIGYRIDESKRGTLGKCSRMLKRLLPELEIKRIMSSEISCEVNQLPPEHVFVNVKPLCKEELVELMGCPHPPKNLRPGNYWYDKVSGLWGKEGKKPCQVISPQLNVGGHIMRKASNGNTNVLVNNREITKEELWTLQLAGVECEGSPHFWVSADGSYQEEGQNNIRGRIWDKTRIKLLCAVLSLPIPPHIVNPGGEEINNPVNGVLTESVKQKTLNKLLLVGYTRSGTSTIFKQAKLLYNGPFSKDERQNIKFMIQSNLYGYLGILLEGREQFEEESLIEMRNRQSIDQSGPSAGSIGENDNKTIYSIGPRLKAFSDWLVKVMISGNLETIFPAATREYAPFVEELWKDAAIQATYGRRSELEMLSRVASYFLDRAVEISKTDYEPSDTDILYAEGISSSNGLASMEFSFPKQPRDGCMDPVDQHDPSLRYQLIRIHARSLGEKCKWLEMFEDVGIVLFCVSLTDYDQFFDDHNGVSTNKMLASKQLFESIVAHPTFDQKNFCLIFNKFDLLEEKIEEVPLTQCEWFNDFNPMISNNHNNSNNINGSPSLAQRAFHYIAAKFKRHFHSLTGNKLYVSLVTGLEPDTVDDAFRYAREILKWDGEKPSFGLNEWSSYSIEASSSS